MINSSVGSKKILAFLVVSQFCGTSLWFAGNAAFPILQEQFYWPTSAISHLTSAVQAGFISGTLFFALLGIADRFSPSKIFLFSSIAGAIANALCLLDASSLPLALSGRFLTGVCLAGIYPIGMKIAADWNPAGLGKWLGALVGALALGTAFPHLLALFAQEIHAARLLLIVSGVAIAGGLILTAFIGDGPHRKPASQFSFSALQKAFSIPDFRNASTGYFGHMWELYTFWAFVPWMITLYKTQHELPSTSLLSFFVMGVGSVGCLAGGMLSARWGSSKVANLALWCSGICCLVSPLLWKASPVIFILVLMFWGLTVIADSPQFSSLVASSVPAQIKGSAITLVTCIGFSITIVSIQLLDYLRGIVPDRYLLILLGLGPLLGLLVPRMNRKNR